MWSLQMQQLSRAHVYQVTESSPPATRAASVSLAAKVSCLLARRGVLSLLALSIRHVSLHFFMCQNQFVHACCHTAILMGEFAHERSAASTTLPYLTSQPPPQVKDSDAACTRADPPRVVRPALNLEAFGNVPEYFPPGPWSMEDILYYCPSGAPGLDGHTANGCSGCTRTPCCDWLVF